MKEKEKTSLLMSLTYKFEWDKINNYFLIFILKLYFSYFDALTRHKKLSNTLLLPNFFVLTIVVIVQEVAS